MRTVVGVTSKDNQLATIMEVSFEDDWPAVIMEMIVSFKDDQRDTVVIDNELAAIMEMSCEDDQLAAIMKASYEDDQMTVIMEASCEDDWLAIMVETSHLEAKLAAAVSNIQNTLCSQGTTLISPASVC